MIRSNRIIILLTLVVATFLLALGPKWFANETFANSTKVSSQIRNDRGTLDPADDTVATFSSRGPTIDGFAKPDVLVPGVDITSLMADTFYVPKKKGGLAGIPNSLSQAQGKPTQTTSQYYVNMSGTSMATPIVLGKSLYCWNETQLRNLLLKS